MEETTDFKKDKGKILFLSGVYPNRGGPISMLTLISLLREKGYNVQLIIGRHGAAENFEHEYGVKSFFIKSYNWIIKINSKRSLLQYLKILRLFFYNMYAERKLYNAIKKFKPDVVVMNSSNQYVGIRSCNRLKVPVIMIFREFMTLDHGRKFWSEKFAQRYLSKLNGGIAISKSIKQYFTKYGIPNLEVIYNGVDECKYKIPKRISNENFFKIACVGKLSDGKNQLLALKAVVLLIKRGVTNFHISFYGEEFPEYRNKLENFAKKNDLKSYVSFDGQVSDPSIIYSDAQINLLCSKSEAFGRVIVEGMMSECLSIVSNSGGACEIVQDHQNGLLFENNNEESLCNVLEYAIKNFNELKDMINQGYHDALENYTSQKNAENIEKYLKYIVEGNTTI